MIEYATIIPAKDKDGNSKATTQGSRVVLPSGERLPGVTRVTLVGEADDAWRATIECAVRVHESGIQVVPKVVRGRLSAWQKLCAWLGGFYVDKTDLDSLAREYVSARRA